MGGPHQRWRPYRGGGVSAHETLRAMPAVV
jgi:hypothetical protein